MSASFLGPGFTRWKSTGEREAPDDGDKSPKGQRRPGSVEDEFSWHHFDHWLSQSLKAAKKQRGQFKKKYFEFEENARLEC